MITRFHVENYKALRDATLELTPIHVLIGPNDSGKTSIREAFVTLSRVMHCQVIDAFRGGWQGRELVWKQREKAPVLFQAILNEDNKTVHYNITCRFPSSVGRNVEIASENAEMIAPESKNGNLLSRHPQWSAVALSCQQEVPPADSWITKPIQNALGRLQCYQWTPSHLPLPVASRTSPCFEMEGSGFGLPLVLDNIQKDDHTRFAALEERFLEFFPYIKRIKLPPAPGFNSWREMNPGAPGVGLQFDLREGGILPAFQASDGLLLVLAYLTLLSLPEPPRILFVEEPENGIHPQRLRDVLNMLKEMVHEQSRTQVLLTTHSPYVVDCFEPSEVALCLKDKDGAVTTHRLSESKTVREQIDIFQLGEIWTAEGDEALAGQAVEN